MENEFTIEIIIRDESENKIIHKTFVLKKIGISFYNGSQEPGVLDLQIDANSIKNKKATS